MRFAAFSSTVTVVSGRSYAGRFGFGVDPWEVGRWPHHDCANACTGLRGDLLSIRDLTRDELIALIALARDIRLEPSRYDQVLAGKTLATIFEKPSLRTRVSFDVATYQLGGHAIGLGPQEVGLGGRESSILCAR